MKLRRFCPFLVLAILMPAVLSAAAPVAKALHPGRVEAASASTAFIVTALEGQLLQVRIEQNRLPVTVRWLNPKREIVTETRNQTRDEHAAILSAIAPTSGEYRLDVQLPPAPERKGEFRIVLSPLRKAVEADTGLIAGEKIYSEGIALLAKPGAANARNAISKFNEAANLWHGDPREALAMYQLSEASFIGGDAKASIKWSTAALAQYRKWNDPLGISGALNNQGVAHNALGESRRAIECYTEALPFARQLPDRFTIGNLLNSLGRAYANLSENDFAIRYLNESLTVWRETKEVRWQGITLNNLGLAYRVNGELERAREMLKQSLIFRRASGDLAGEATTATNLGLVELQEGDLQGAQQHFEHALELRRKLGNAREIASAQHQAGSLHLARGQLAQAEHYLVAALEGRRISGDRIGEASSLLMLAKTYFRRGSAVQAVEPLNQALTITRQIGARLEEATVLSTLARVRGALGDPEAALELAEASIQVHEALRSAVTDPQSKARYLASVRDQYDSMVARLIELRSKDEQLYAGKALEASERAHARSLLDLLEEARVDIREGVDRGVIGRETALRENLTKLGNRAGSEAELAETIRQLSDTQAEIRRQSPAFAALGNAPLLTAAAIQRDLLDSETALLEFSLGDELSFAWIVTSESLTVFPLPARPELERLARAAYRDFAVSNSTEASILALSRAILWPLAAGISKPRLAIVADGALLQIPFGALWLPGMRQRLSSRVETVYLPSASALASLRKQVAARPLGTRVAAILADPVFGTNDVRLRAPHPSSQSAGFERLPASRAEARSIAALLPGAEVRMGFDARRNFFYEQGLDQYRVLHLATHSVLNSRRPELSGVVFSQVDSQGRAQDGFLPLHEISRLKLGAGLVVLSACETALGKEVRGEGLVGLSRAFLFAGTPRVVASLWQVPDQATAELMKRFYAAMIGGKMRPAQALRAAQLEIRAQRRWQRPYYWAGFVLQGDWR